jgi:hypothetical protein
VETLQQITKDIMSTSVMHGRALRLACAAALMLLAQFAPQLAHAQYSWIDDKGTRVFSDRPPPPGTPASRILKAPHRLAAGADDTPAAAASPAPANAPLPSSLADREADYRKRQAQRQEEETKAQQDAARKKAMCADARQQEVQLASGMRIAQMDVNGERSYMSDEERARRLTGARQALSGCR